MGSVSVVQRSNQRMQVELHCLMDRESAWQDMAIAVTRSSRVPPASARGSRVALLTPLRGLAGAS